MKAYHLYYLAAVLFVIAAILNIVNESDRKVGYFMFLPAVAMIFAGIADYKKRKM